MSAKEQAIYDLLCQWASQLIAREKCIKLIAALDGEGLIVMPDKSRMAVADFLDCTELYEL